MRRRNVQIPLRVSEKELKIIERKAAQSGLTREAYLRASALEMQLKEQPTISKDVIYQLRMIGNNFHQVAVKANSLNLIDAPLYRKNYEDLQELIGKIMEVIF